MFVPHPRRTRDQQFISSFLAHLAHWCLVHNHVQYEVKWGNEKCLVWCGAVMVMWYDVVWCVVWDDSQRPSLGSQTNMNMSQVYAFLFLHPFSTPLTECVQLRGFIAMLAGLLGVCFLSFFAAGRWVGERE